MHRQGAGLLIDISISTPRSPRLRALLDDSIIISATSARVTHTSSFSAATYSVTVSLSDTPNLDASYWATITQIHLRLQVSLGATEPFVDLVEGYCDTVHLHPQSRLVILEGRDFSASLLDTKTFVDFQNQSLSDVVKKISVAHNLTPVLTDSNTFTGRFYGGQTNIISLSQFSRLTSDWDVLVTLAQIGGLDLFVSGSSLHMQPQTSTALPVHIIQYTDLIDVQMSRILPLHKGVNLTVMSWNSSEQTAVSEISDNIPVAGSSNPDPSLARKYTIIQPNLRPDDAKTLAAQMAGSILSEAMSVQLTMPGDVSMMARDLFALRGSGTVFDQTYKTKSLTRTFRPQTGYTQVVRATSVT